MFTKVTLIHLALQKTVLADNGTDTFMSRREYMQTNVPVFILCDLTHSHITVFCPKTSFL
jgi:hypothetical protein